MEQQAEGIDGMTGKIETWDDAHQAIIDVLAFVQRQTNLDARKPLDCAPYLYYELSPIERQLRKVETRVRDMWIHEQREGSK